MSNRDKELDVDVGKKKIHVVIKKEDNKAEIERLTALLDEKDRVLEDLAQQAFQEKLSELKERYPQHRERLETIEKPSQLAFVESFLTNEKPRKISTGSVRLRQTPYVNDVMQRSWENPREMIEYVYSVANDPSDPNYNVMQKVKKQLREKLEAKDFAEVKELKYITDPIEKKAVKELGRNFGYEAYTEFVQRLAREKQNVK